METLITLSQKVRFHMKPIMLEQILQDLSMNIEFVKIEV